MRSSILRPGEIILNDTTPEELHAPPAGRGRGLELARRGPAGYGASAADFPAELEIPESEWQARIKELEDRRQRASDLIEWAGLPCKDQQQTNYCWANAPTHCVEITRLIQNQETVILSPASAGAQIKGYRNVGGWGKEALDFIVANGLVPVDKWPANAIDRRYATPANLELAKKYRVTEWFELRPNNRKQLISCVLRGLPVAVGYNWWSHEVTAVDAVWLDGEAALRIRNSWSMDWPKEGGHGYAVLQGSKMDPDDAVTPRVAIAA